MKFSVAKYESLDVTVIWAVWWALLVQSLFVKQYREITNFTTASVLGQISNVDVPSSWFLLWLIGKEGKSNFIMILSQTTNCRRLGKELWAFWSQGWYCCVRSFEHKNLLWMCPASPWSHKLSACWAWSSTVHLHSVRTAGFHLGFLWSFYLLVSVLCRKCWKRSKCWFCDHLFNVNYGYNCQDAWTCMCGKTRVYTFQRCAQIPKTWLKTLRYIREILFKLKKKVCMYVTGMLFEGSKRQIHSKSRISGLVSKFCCGSWGRKFFHFLQP